MRLTLFCSHFLAKPTQLKEKELKPIPSCESSHKLFAGLQSVRWKLAQENTGFLLVGFFTGADAEPNDSA